MKKLKTISKCLVCVLGIGLLGGSQVWADESDSTSLRLKRLRKENRELIRITRELKNEIRTLKGEARASVSSRSSSQTAKSSEQPNEVDRLSQQKIALSKSLELANEQIRTQQEEIKKLEKLRQQIAELQTQRDKLENELLAAMNQVHQVESSIPALIEAVRIPLNERVTSQKKELDGYVAKEREIQARLENSERERLAFKSKLEALQKDIAQRDDQLSKITDTLLEERKQAEGIKSENSRLEKLSAQNSETIAALTNENQQAKQIILAKSKTEEELTEMQRKKEFLEKQLVILTERTKNIDVITSELKQVQKPFSQEIARLEENIQKLSSELAQKDVVIKTLRNQNGTRALAAGDSKVGLDDLINIREELDKAIGTLPKK